MKPQVYIYSAKKVCQLLGVPNTCTIPMPETLSLHAGEILLWFPGYTLTQLRNSALGKECMWQSQDWYDEKNFASAKPGYYVLQLRVPDSNSKKWSEQQALLPQVADSCQPAPAAVSALALLLHLQVVGFDLLQGDWCRCIEESAQGYRVILMVDGGRVNVDHSLDDGRFIGLWLAAARKY